MAMKIVAARTARELDEVFRLRHRVFVREFHRFPRREEDTRLVDLFDTVPGTTILAAETEDGHVVGTLRVNEDTEVGLPADEYIDLSKTRETLRREGGRLMGCSMLVVDPEHRFGKRAVFDLFGGAREVMRLGRATQQIRPCTSIML